MICMLEMSLVYSNQNRSWTFKNSVKLNLKVGKTSHPQDINGPICPNELIFALKKLKIPWTN
ncbi:hypothetical protein BpHYR1_054359 [Brachionus plicatilis]|uniref:Uncharacterized protein n=1 Tax=Brachionus plicatilis TaxID=10195 RepID=A0A3M7RE95_BRAPC|nr:hypothetical protein BpHYR1_054359 [Brachionus plicatilis]